jgi:DnaK suppressor protein
MPTRANATPLSPKQIAELTRHLDEREVEVRRELRNAEEASDESLAAPADVGDAVDVGDARFRAGMAHVDEQRDREEAMAIDAARARMADGSYGECVDCGMAIPFERLKAQPTALRCVPCQSVYEKTHPTAPMFSV